MRILQLTETLHAGGAETFVVRLSNALVEAGHEVTVAVAVPIVNPAVRAALDPRVAVEVLPLPRWRWWSKAESAFRKAGIRIHPFQWCQRRWLERLISERQPDVIHSHLFKVDLLATVVRRRFTAIGHVVTVHGDYPMYLDGSADPLMLDAKDSMCLVAKSADAIVGVAAANLRLFQDVLGADADRLYLIYNGYPAPNGSHRTRGELGLPEGKFLFGMVGRGIEGKGWGEAVAAFARLDQADAALVLVGEGPALERLRGEVVNPNVHFADFAPDPIDFVRHFDVGLLPSRAEALPTAIIEYLACGKPVIATDVGEVTAMLLTDTNESAGIVLDISAGDFIGELAEAMQLMINDSEWQRQFAGRAQAAFAKFDMTRCVERYEALFRSHSSANRSRH